MSKFSNQIYPMDPLLPLPLPGSLEELAIEVIRQSAKLGALLNPLTRESIVELFREMNSYYSNLIEGHNTKPLDIQRALRQNYSKDPAKRALQEESIAHIEVQKLIANKLKENLDTKICSVEFLKWIHKEFYKRLPEAFKVVRGNNGTENQVFGGELRNRQVIVGDHIPPDSNRIEELLLRFEEAYENNNLNAVMQIIAIAASHHRLAWIHPFLDGNGRIIRLFSDAYFIKAGVSGHGLWTISRGLARNRSLYMNALANADAPRQGDYDGRGSLSLKGLIQFCEFFLETSLDQINYMSSMLDLSNFQARMDGYVNYLVGQDKIKPEAAHLLKDTFIHGEIARGEAARITGMPERTARNLLKQLLVLNLLVSNSPKGPVRLGFPISAVEFYFPKLYKV